MAKKTKSIEQPTRPSAWRLTVPADGVKLPGPGALKELRERLGVSQPALAQECGVSRDVIANYETGRTKLESIEDVLKIYRVLQVKEHALNISQETKNDAATDWLLAVLWWAKQMAQKQLAEIQGQFDNLKREREGVRRRVAEIESEEKHLKAQKAAR